MSNIPQKEPDAAQGALEAAALRSLAVWRHRDREHLGDKGSRDKQRAEFHARQALRGAADRLKGGES